MSDETRQRLARVLDLLSTVTGGLTEEAIGLAESMAAELAATEPPDSPAIETELALGTARAAQQAAAAAAMSVGWLRSTLQLHMVRMILGPAEDAPGGEVRLAVWIKTRAALEHLAEAIESLEAASTISDGPGPIANPFGPPDVGVEGLFELTAEPPVPGDGSDDGGPPQ